MGAVVDEVTKFGGIPISTGDDLSAGEFRKISGSFSYGKSVIDALKCFFQTPQDLGPRTLVFALL
jgi:hypothetical protein